MNKTKKIIISSLAVFLTAVLAVGAYILFGVVGIESKRTYPESDIVNSNINSGSTVIDENAVYQKIKGFGASACWWSKDIGGWENCSDILSLLYDKEKGIGLNIYRYNLGAGSENDDALYIQSHRTECFLNENGEYNFNADTNSQKALQQAKALAGDDLRVTLFCNSPPVSLTKNGKAYCDPVKDDNEPWVSNLDEANYEKYADFCYNCADYFLKQGYRVTEVSPINEPQYRWKAWYNEDGSYSMNQEGNHYTKQQSVKLFDTMVKKFRNSEVDEKGCKVAMFESGAFEGKGTTPAAYLDCLLGKGPKYVFKNKNSRNYFTTVSAHSYWSDEETKKSTADYFANKYSNYDIACTEYCQMRNDGSTGVYDLISEIEGISGLGIEFGVAMADIIMTDLTVLNAVEWDWWLACAYSGYTDGLVYVNSDNHSDIQTSKRLWCLGNFSKFIHEGAERIACSSGVEGLKSTAFKNTDGSTVIVYVNSSDKALTTSLNGIQSKNADVYETSAQRDLEKTFSAESISELNVPAQSVVTVVIK